MCGTCGCGTDGNGTVITSPREHQHSHSHDHHHHDHDHGHHHHHHHHDHDHSHDEFDTIVVEMGEVSDPEALQNAIVKLARERNILRVKGYIAVQDKPMRLLVQAVLDGLYQRTGRCHAQILELAGEPR